jgi:hypothetical protein
LARSPIVGTWNRAVVGMAFPIIVRDRATQDIRRQANYILAMGNRDAAEIVYSYQAAIKSDFLIMRGVGNGL